LVVAVTSIRPISRETAQPAPADEARLLRSRLGMFATGVCIVLVDRDGAPTPAGVTVNSFTSVSLDPPLLLWCLKSGSPRRADIETSRLYSINVLARGQDETALAFARRLDLITDPDALGLVRGDAGVWSVEGALATFTVRPSRTIEAGDHMMYLVELVDHSGQTGEPLLFFGGQFRALAESAPPRPEARLLEAMLAHEWY